MSSEVQIDLLAVPICASSALARRSRPRKHGYAADPGTGPIGQICGGCEHYVRLDGHAKVYRKCALRRTSWTNGAGTDIKAGSAACRFWEGRS
jgi:hypothetical protein